MDGICVILNNSDAVEMIKIFERNIRELDEEMMEPDDLQLDLLHPIKAK